MSLRIVQPGKHRIFETYPALPGKIILLYKSYDIFDIPGFLRRHQLESLLRERVVKTYRQMTFAVVKEAFQVRQYAYGGKGYPLWAPSETPVSGKDFDCTGYIFIVVKRFAHPHKYCIGQFVGLLNADKL